MARCVVAQSERGYTLDAIADEIDRAPAEDKARLWSVVRRLAPALSLRGERRQGSSEGSHRERP